MTHLLVQLRIERLDLEHQSIDAATVRPRPCPCPGPRRDDGVVIDQLLDALAVLNLLEV